ncbi:odorant receptor 94a-like isoform X1 [Bradysia coprophila]|uniref:odorant receptor 94a-like isoform X1 n=1 Tax=Bradysia coprophila TaxID=38358 RepID=UPI00187DB10E|nr:odorant receptor 94a-like isoform X1 [Bradysia coprophila]
MEKKYKLKMLDTFRKMSATCFILGLWNSQHWKASFPRIFTCLLFLSCTLSTTLQVLITDDNDESVFLGVTTLICVVQTYRLFYIILKQRKVIDLMQSSSASSTDDYEAFCNVMQKLTNFTMFVKYFLATTFSSFLLALFTPLVTKQLMFNIAFPLDYKTDDNAFWMAYAFITASFLLSVTCCLLTSMNWYIMMNFVVKFELLGNDFKNLGVTTVEAEGQESISLTSRQAKQTLYLRHLIEAIKSLESTTELLDEFASTFSSLFLLQIFTSSLSICGGVYSLAFSSHDDPIQDGFYSIVEFYCFFDTFALMYLGNEIMVSSDKLSYCLFESNWIEQTQSCKRNILILVEYLQQPQQIIVCKLFPLNLESFSIIVNRAYSMFNLLQNFRT